MKCANNNEIENIYNCSIDGIECDCKNCKDDICKDFSCGTCIDNGEYFEKCPGKRERTLNLKDTEAVLEFLKKVLQVSRKECEQKNDAVQTDKNSETEALQKGRIETYDEIINVINGLLTELAENK
jgi:hypothetical protein